MAVIEFELERTISAPVEQVFARLTDINEHNEWMPKKGSILKHTEQTSHGEPTVGTVQENATRVRHHAKMHAHGIYGFGMPLWRRLAVRERSTGNLALPLHRIDIFAS